MRLAPSSTSRRSRSFGLAVVLGGLLWVPYGVFEMLEPWGTDAVYREDLGYSVVTDVSRFVTYSLPGSLALLLTTLGLFGILARLRLPAGGNGRLGRILAYVALGLALLSTAGVILLVDPVFTAGRVFGTLALGAATVLLAAGARKAGTSSRWTLGLLGLGLIGLLLFPLWPLVYALAWLSRGMGAAIIALYGLGWVVAGYRLRSATS